jgi:hypothetical protein
MASKHQLSLEVPDTNNTSVLRVFDTSLYSNDLPVDCGVLQITAPGYNLPVAIDVLPNFNLVLNGCTLGIQTQDCGSVSATIPDGLYRIRYSVSPNSNVYVEYDHLRVTQTNNLYFKELCKLELAACEPDADVKASLEELSLIKSFIDGAKVKVEYCHDSEAGMGMLLYAQKRLLKIANTCH